MCESAINLQCLYLSMKSDLFSKFFHRKHTMQLSMWYYVIMDVKQPSEALIIGSTFITLVAEIIKFAFFFGINLCTAKKWQFTQGNVTEVTSQNLIPYLNNPQQASACEMDRASYASAACFAIYFISLTIIAVQVWVGFPEDHRFKRIWQTDGDFHLFDIFSGKPKAQRDHEIAIRRSSAMSQMTGLTEYNDGVGGSILRSSSSKFPRRVSAGSDSGSLAGISIGGHSEMGSIMGYSIAGQSHAVRSQGGNSYAGQSYAGNSYSGRSSAYSGRL